MVRLADRETPLFFAMLWVKKKPQKLCTVLCLKISKTFTGKVNHDTLGHLKKKNFDPGDVNLTNQYYKCQMPRELRCVHLTFRLQLFQAVDYVSNFTESMITDLCIFGK